MTVTCPGCGWSANVPDEKIPPEGGIKATCRKCQAKFEVRKESNPVNEQPPIPPPITANETVNQVSALPSPAEQTDKNNLSSPKKELTSTQKVVIGIVLLAIVSRSGGGAPGVIAVIITFIVIAAMCKKKPVPLPTPIDTSPFSYGTSQQQPNTLGAGKGAAVGFVTGSTATVVLLAIACLCFFIPVIGPIVGMILIFIAIAAPFVGTGLGGAVGRVQIQVKGPCPYCGGNLVAGVFNNQVLGIDCPVCRKRVVVKENRFVRVN